MTPVAINESLTFGEDDGNASRWVGLAEIHRATAFRAARRATPASMGD